MYLFRPNISETVGEKLIQMVHRSTRRAFIALMLGYIVHYQLLHESVSTPWLYAWIGISGLAIVVRMLILEELTRRTDIHYRKKLKIAIFLSAITGSSYGAVMLFFPALGEFERGILTAMLLTVSVGAVLANSGYRPLFLAFASPIFLGLAVLWMINPGNVVDTVLAWSFGTLILLMSISVSVMAQETFDAFAISVESTEKQRQLATRLSAALDDAEEAQRLAESSSESKTRFLAAASHDLRQPVHVLSLYGAVLDSAPLDTKARAAVADMNIAIESLSSQLDTLLDMSRLDAGAVKPNVQSVDLQRLVHELTHEFEPLAANKGIALINTLDRALYVRTDPNMMSQILRNLCGNAIKYTRTGSITLSTSAVPADDGRTRIELSVTDTGIGIPEEEQAHIFEEFYQVANPGRDKRMGLGLGLSIVKRLVTRLGHGIHIHSTENLGTCVTLTLDGAMASVRPETRHLRSAGQVLPRGLHVHVVDDDPLVRRSMRLLLADKGCTVSSTASSDETLNYLADNHPDILLIDYRLADGDSGIRLVEWARTHRPQEVGVALITGEFVDIDGLSDRYPGLIVLEKPIGEPLLLQTLHDLLAHTRQDSGALPTV